ncbi:Pacrg, partial [Symbiodinium sp. KB8]
MSRVPLAPPPWHSCPRFARVRPRPRLRALPPVPWASLAAVKPSAETGSCFDTTRVGTRVAAPGSHTVTPSSASTGGFGAASSTSKPRTDKFLRRGMGTGGTHDAGLASTAARRRASGAAAASSAAPPRAGATRRRANPPTSALRRAYERGDLPVAIMQSVTNKLSWKVKVETLDLAHYLPLFCDGLREVEEPYRFIAEEGVYDLLLRSPLPKVLACVPVIVVPLKTALNTRIPSVIKRALVPFYRQLLPVLAIFKNKKKNLGDAMDYRPDDGIGELIDETLEKLEVTGGPDAFVNIKYL